MIVRCRVDCKFYAGWASQGKYKNTDAEYQGLPQLYTDLFLPFTKNDLHTAHACCQ